jgi:hypothetical protein
MWKLKEIIICLIILVVLVFLYNQKFNDKDIVRKEGFRTDTQNYVYNNVYENADRLDYSNKEAPGMYNRAPSATMGPSSDTGVNQNNPTTNASAKDVFDNRGYKWTANAKDPEVDVITKMVDDKILRQKFERTYMLDPDGSVAQYDPTYFKISPNCCPAQYAPPFKLTDKDETNCDYAQKYVANNYSGMNYQDGYGCVCMTPKQADFYGTRGGNTN